MNLAPHLYTQQEIMAGVRSRMRDRDSVTRYTDEEIYDAVNDALADWEGRVQVPRYYDVDFTSGDYEYTLPDYIDAANLDVQIKRTVWGLNTDTGDSWEDVYEDLTSWYVIPSATGGMTLCIENAVNTQDGRIIWWGHNGRVPATTPTVQTEIDSDDTTLILSTLVPDIGRAGYVKIGNEWIAYAGYTDNGTYTSLTNLVRGLNGTTAATHAVAAKVFFGIAMPSERLRLQLYDQIAMRLHALFLTNGAPNESEHHERLMGYYQQRSDAFWRTWVPARAPKMRLTRRGVGDIGDNDRWDYRHYWDSR